MEDFRSTILVLSLVLVRVRGRNTSNIKPSSFIRLVFHCPYLYPTVLTSLLFYVTQTPLWSDSFTEFLLMLFYKQRISANVESYKYTTSYGFGRQLRPILDHEDSTTPLPLSRVTSSTESIVLPVDWRSRQEMSKRSLGLFEIRGFALFTPWF